MSELTDTKPRNIAPKKKRSIWRILLGILILAAFIALGSVGGYYAGVGDRRAAEATQSGQTLLEQFTLAQEDMAAGRYDFARQRLEYILKRDPAYPGATDMLANVLVQMAVTPSPTITLTPTLTPTPDLRNAEEIFNQAQARINMLDWDRAIESLDALRKSAPTYRVVDVDGMYYLALRNRGVDKILGRGLYAQESNLEGGIYDLTLAETFAPLDGQADGYRTYARFYRTGASYWELDWEQALYYFAQVYQQLPYLRDGGGMTATERFRIASIQVGNLSYDKRDWCLAVQYYDGALSVGNLVINGDTSAGDKYTDAYNQCNPPTPTQDVNPFPFPGFSTKTPRPGPGPEPSATPTE